MEVPNIVNREFRDCAEKFLQYLENMIFTRPEHEIRKR